MKIHTFGESNCLHFLLLFIIKRVVSLIQILQDVSYKKPEKILS